MIFFFLDLQFLTLLPLPFLSPSLCCSSSCTCVSLRPPFLPQNWFIPRPTLHLHAAVHANSFGPFLCLCQSAFLISCGLFFFAASDPSTPSHLLLSVLHFSLCRLAWVCSCLSSCVAILRLQERRERRGWGTTKLAKMKNNGFHWPRDELLTLHSSTSLTHTDAHSSTHISTTSAPIT